MRKHWKIGISQDTSTPVLGFHGLHYGFHGLPGAEIVGHVDSNAENVQHRMGYGAKQHYLDYTEMLDKEKPDIVVLCSRHPYDHLRQVELAAERGIHLYCEKPLAVSLGEADQMVEIAEKHKIKICMAHPIRYSLAFRTMKSMIEAGEIGTPIRINGRGKCDHRGGGEDLVVLGTHILDFQTFIFGQPEYVFADVTANGKPIVKTDREETVEPLGPLAGDTIFAYFRYPNDVCGTFESRRCLFNIEGGMIHMGVTVTGTKGTLSMRFNDCVPCESNLRISRCTAPPEDYNCYEDVKLVETRTIEGAEPLNYSACGKVSGVPVKPLFLESNRYGAWDLMCAIEENRQPISNIYNARLTVEMINGVYASHLSGQTVRFPLRDRSQPLE